MGLPSDPFTLSIQDAVPQSSPASSKLPPEPERFCHSWVYALSKDLLIGSSLYTSCSSVSNPTVDLLSIYICLGSISEGYLFSMKAQRLPQNFTVKILPKSIAKTENRCSVYSSAASLGVLLAVGMELEHHLRMPGLYEGGANMTMETRPDNCVKNHPSWFKPNKQEILISCQHSPHDL
jgi:hypothetical protein